MENYLMLNGKRIDLTEEQIRTLGLEVRENPFERYGDYYWIGASGDINKDYEYEGSGCKVSELRYNVANYCKDVTLMKQRALHETLDRLLWRFSMQNDGDKIDWNDSNSLKYCICYDSDKHKIVIDSNAYVLKSCVYFYTREITKKAIDEIILPFMKKHPEFVW